MSNKIIEKGNRISERYKNKFEFLREHGSGSEIKFHLYPKDKFKKTSKNNNAITDETHCFVCNDKVPRAAVIRAYGTLPKADNNFEKTNFSFRHFICGEKCKNEYETAFNKFVKEGRFIDFFKFRKMIYKILHYVEWWEASIHDATISFVRKENPSYICGGCRSRKPMSDDYNDIYAETDKSAAWYSKAFVARVCSKECYDFFLMKIV